MWLLVGAFALITLSALTAMQPDVSLPLRRAIAVGLAFVGAASLPVAWHASGRWNAKAAAFGVLVAALLVVAGAYALWG